MFGATCFYCGNSLTEGEVDHFVPFSAYPRDLGHNFVLSHPTCNQSKSDSLAAYDHLARWLERNDLWRQEIAEIAEECGLVHEADATRAIADWSYRSGCDVHGLAWVAERLSNPSASGTSLYSNTEPLERSNPNFQQSVEGFVQPAMRGNVDDGSISTTRHKDAINILPYR